MRRKTVITISLLLAMMLAGATVYGRNPIRNAFFTAYPNALGTQLDDLPSNAGHCGVCHLDFDGGGPRNAYGLAIEVERNGGATNAEAIANVELFDSDNDGFSNLTEVTSTLFDNTPTFPGLAAGDTLTLSNVAISDIRNYLVPAGAEDTTPPTVSVLSPSGGEVFDAGSTQLVTWTASDASGIAFVNIDFSSDGGASFKPIALEEPNDGSFDWFVPNLPGGSGIIRVVARDGAANYGSAWSNGLFSVNATLGVAPTTLRDMEMPGSQPFTGTALEDPDVNCVSCHGGYDPAIEPWEVWKGSMMAQAMRDPIFLATMVVAEQDAPSSGDLCLRCHTPGGWLEGRSMDTSGGQLIEKDLEGVQCDFCHRLVDPIYDLGVDPPENVAILDSLDTVPLATANGQFVTDPNPPKRGPYSDAVASHPTLESPFQRADLCGTCHDVSNPVFEAGATPGDYVPGAFDTPHPDGDPRNMFPVERTFSEWTQSDYANGGVFAPQFAGDKPDGIVSTCQDCHMRDVTGKGCNEPGAPTRNDLPLHDLTGGNYFMPDIIPDFFPGEVDPVQLQAGKQRAIAMLQLAATMALAPGQAGNRPTVTVTVTNETGHKLPSGYPEGRRVWVNLRAYDSGDNLVYESGAYNAATGVLSHDEDAKIYEIHLGISPVLAGILGMPAGESFHFVLNDTVYFDNRIPPRGYTYANFETVQSPPVAYSYPDGQYWDETKYILPAEAVSVRVNLYYQSTSKEYVEFLRDANTTNTLGQELYDAWVGQGRAAPVTMATDSIELFIDPTGVGDRPLARTELYPNVPNPFNPVTAVHYSLAQRAPVRIAVFDVRGALVRTLVDDVRPAGAQRTIWHGTDAAGQQVSSGVYFIRMTTPGYTHVQKAVMLK